ncbi:hypothetical protein [Ruegeria sp. HKCCD6428]|uniref:hypothetical protein n=1 Tax=Ruegeria sp. HKCCD6428 TaxID=2683002 RepID=UPI0014925AEF|nr:hypothetical protein [Ruegeria sp. HKCCD6428]NOC83834.1 hypothetical protein [Ruegeria sp. HKCCD6428]
MTLLRRIRVVGPSADGKPLWKLETDVVYGGHGTKQGRVVDNVATLRGLSLSNASQVVKNKKDGETYNVNAPTLLQAKQRFEKGRTARIFDPVYPSTIFNLKGEDESENDLFLAAPEDWPDTEIHSGGTPEITTPDMRCVAGSMDLRLPAKSGLARLLNYNAGTHSVFSGNTLRNSKAEGLKVTLVPEGIEIDLWMPNPLKDLPTDPAGGGAQTVASQMEVIPVRIRLEWTDQGYIARLVGVHTKAMAVTDVDLMKEFANAILALRNVSSPILAEVDTRCTLPPFSWRLDQDRWALHVRAQDGSGDDWRIKLDPDLMVVRLETDTGFASGQKAIARLDLDQRASESGVSPRLDLVKNGARTMLRYALKKDGAPAPLLVAHYGKSAEGAFAFSHLATREGLPTYTPLKEAADRRQQPNNRTQNVILPVGSGTLQLQWEPPQKEEVPTGVAPPRRSTLQGNCVFLVDAQKDLQGYGRPDTARFVVEVNDAGQTEAAITWETGNAVEITLGFDGVTGALRAALWTAEEAPTPDRLLPTGRRDPASLHELTPIFGAVPEQNSTLTFTQDTNGQAPSAQWQLTLDHDTRTLLWTTTEGLPLVTAAPMLAAGEGDRPSELRSLVPVSLGTPLVLRSGHSALMDLATAPDGDTNFPWPWATPTSMAEWGPVSVQMVSPVAPGLDYAVRPGSLPTAASTEVSMRFDLPILDELFAGVSAEELKQDDKTLTPVPQAAIFGVLDFDEMARLWTERSFQLAATRTQDARATGWAPIGTSVPGPIKLAAPYNANATVRFTQDYDLTQGSKIRFGGYLLKWDSEATPELFSGEKALLGPMQENGDKPLPIKIEAGTLRPTQDSEEPDLIIAGFAPDAYPTDIGLADTRGTSMHAAVNKIDGGIKRAAGFLAKANEDTSEIALFTHDKALEVTGFGDDKSIKFWVRDLPLTNGVFDARTNPFEGSIGPDASSFEAAALQTSLYEWRFFDDLGESQPLNFHIRLGALDLAPLRLLSYTPGGDAFLLMRASLALSQATERRPEAPYETGPLLVIQLMTTPNGMALKQVAAVRLKPRKKPEDSLFEGLYDVQGGTLQPTGEKLRFDFEADLTVDVAGKRDETVARLAVSLTGTPTTEIDGSVLEDVTLEFDFLDRQLVLTVAEEAPGHYHYDAPKATPDASVWIQEADLKRDAANWTLDLSLGAQASLRPGGPVVLCRAPDGLTWLGLGKVVPTRVRVDVERASLWIEREDIAADRPSFAEPISGIAFETIEALHYSAALALDVTDRTKTAPVWGIQTATILAEVTGGRTTEIGQVPDTQTRTESLSLRSHTTCRKGNWQSRVSLDRHITETVDAGTKRDVFAFQTSGIAWDPEAVSVTMPTGTKARFRSSTVTTKRTAPYQHAVSISLRDHSLPIDALEANSGQVLLTRSLQMRLQVRHRLVRQGLLHREWRTVEIGVLTSQALWRNELTGRFVFGPRYVSTNAKYRDPASLRPQAPGIGGRAAILSGFDDGVLLDRLDGESTQLLLLGGTPGLLNNGEDMLLFGLPWVISFDAAKPLPEPLDALMQFSGSTMTWKAAQFDSAAFSVPSRSTPSSVSMPSNLLSGDDIEKFMLAQKTSPSGSVSTRLLARMTEQIYIEPVGWDDQIPTSDWPFFLKALIGLQAALDEDPEQWRITSLSTASPNDVRLLDLPSENTEVNLPKPAKRSEIRLLIFSVDGDINWFTLDLPPGVSDLETLPERLGPARQIELALARDASLRLAGFAELGANFDEQVNANLVGMAPIALPDRFYDFGRVTERALIDRGTQIYASAALGWPGSVAHAAPSAQAMVGVADAPVVSKQAGLAARSAVLSSGAAVALGTETGRYLATQSRSVYEHGDGYASATLPAPPARHLSLLPPRVRTPLSKRRTEALKRLLSTTGRLPPTMAVIPPAFSRGYIGARPGTLHTFADAVLTDGADGPATVAGVPEFGRAAVLSPVMARQLRTPRSPALPLDDTFDPEIRRRTFVSAADNLDDKDKTVLIRDAAATMWRLDQTRFVLDLLTRSINPVDVLTAIESGKSFELCLALSHKGPEDVMTALAQSGFLEKSDPDGTATLRAWISVGAKRMSAQSMSWKPLEQQSDDALSIMLAFANLDLTHLLEELRDPDPDTPAQLHFYFFGPGDADKAFERDGTAIIAAADDDKLTDGVPTTLSLPIGRKPLGRPTPNIRRRTYIFADPAFDRVLSSPGKSSPIVRMGQDKATVLAVDRTEYDLTQTLYFAFGFLADGEFKHDPELVGTLTLSLKRQPEPGVDPEAVGLTIEDLKTDAELLASGKAYALPLSRLKPNDDGAPPTAGDQLEVEIALDANGEKKTVGIELSIAEKVTDPRPAAVYSAVGLSQELQPRTLIHAAAPAPDRIEFVELVKDLASGHIRKKAIFEWHETDLADAPDSKWRTLTKTDRSGGAQLPSRLEDFTPPLSVDDLTP